MTGNMSNIVNKAPVVVKKVESGIAPPRYQPPPQPVRQHNVPVVAEPTHIFKNSIPHVERYESMLHFVERANVLVLLLN